MSNIQKCPHCGEFAPYRKQWETREFVKIHCEKCGAWTRYNHEGWENIMNDKTKLIFEILDIKPYEKFRIRYMNEQHLYKDIYRMTDDLVVQATGSCVGWRRTDIDIRDFFVKRYNIVKIQKPTKEEQVAINYARLLGHNWIAKDEDGSIFAYTTKPHKDNGGWSRDDCTATQIEYNISFISYSDSEPYYIGY